MRSLQQLKEELLALSHEDRAFLAEKLAESLEDEIDPVIQSAWLTEARQRLDEVRSGLVEPIDGDEGLAQVSALIGGIQETLYLNSIPGLVESIHRAVQEPLEDAIAVEALDW